MHLPDLIRDYKMRIKGHDSSDSETESQPLLSSNSSTLSFGTNVQNQFFFNESETTDNEAEKRLKSDTKIRAPPNQNLMRRPFCFPGRNEGPTLDIYTSEEKVYERYNYFSKISGVLTIGTSTLIHNNLLNQEKYATAARKTQSSLVTIFSIWNTILGTSMLTMPWGMERAGLFPGIALIILIAGICLFTCYQILKINEVHGSVDASTGMSDLCRLLLGRWAELMAKFFSLIVLIGANIVYWVLMSNFLYNSVNFIYGYVTEGNDASSNETVICPNEAALNLTSPFVYSNAKLPISEGFWDVYTTVPVILTFLMFPLLNFKSVTFFTKFNSLGTLSVMYLLVFIAVKSFAWGININSWAQEFNVKSAICALSGMLSLSYFIHNIIISIMRNNEHQRHNGRDLSIAYGLVTCTYTFIGVAFYISFPLAKECIEDNILNNFNKYDVMTVVARFLLLFQLFTVFPLISYMLRMDVFNVLGMIIKGWSREFSYTKVIAVNVVILTICILFACFLPKIGTLIRYTGAASGLVYVFLLPCLLKITCLKKENQLTNCKLIGYILIISFGVLSFVAQFFINDK